MGEHGSGGQKPRLPTHCREFVDAAFEFVQGTKSSESALELIEAAAKISGRTLTKANS